MSRLYPTLEDMKVDQLHNTQVSHERTIVGAIAGQQQSSQYPNEAPPEYCAQSKTNCVHIITDLLSSRLTQVNIQLGRIPVDRN